jgi:hypothetical protein
MIRFYVAVLFKSQWVTLQEFSEYRNTISALRGWRQMHPGQVFTILELADPLTREMNSQPSFPERVFQIWGEN